jgi:Fic family protein
MSWTPIESNDIWVAVILDIVTTYGKTHGHYRTWLGPMKYRIRKAALTPSLNKLDQRRWLFANMPIDPTHAQWLRRRAWVRTIHGTTRIEGNTLSDVEVEALLTDTAAGRVSDREAREIIGTREALELVDELVGQSKVGIDQQVIREIHRRVLWGQSPLLTPGEYRRGENRVVDPDGATIFTTPPSGDVPSRMDELGSWITNKSGSLDAPTAAALSHLEFVAIHPFNDGNGRTARAISRLVLARHGYAFDGLVSLDAQLDLDRAGYFAAIRAAIGRSYEPGYDATPFVKFFVDSLVQSADHVLERIRGLGLVMIAIRRAIASGSLPAPMIDGLAYAWINRHLRAGDYIRATGRSPQNTTRDLQRAVDDGWLTSAGERRARIYALGPKLLEIPALGEIVSA